MPSVNSIYNGDETIFFLGPKVWDIIPSEIKEKKSLQVFKCAIYNENQKIVHVGSANVTLLQFGLSNTRLQLPIHIFGIDFFLFSCNILFGYHTTILFFFYLVFSV